MRQVQILSHGTLLVIKYRGSASCNTHLLATAAGSILKASLRGGHMQKYLQKIAVVRVGVRSVQKCEGVQQIQQIERVLDKNQSQVL